MRGDAGDAEVSPVSPFMMIMLDLRSRGVFLEDNRVRVNACPFFHFHALKKHVATNRGREGGRVRTMMTMNDDDDDDGDDDDDEDS